MLSENVMPRTKMTCTKFKNSIHANVLVKMDKNMIRRIMVGPNYEVWGLAVNTEYLHKLAGAIFVRI